MPDHPDAPLVKLNVRRTIAEEQGKEFDEALERKLLGLPPSPVAVVLPAAPERVEMLAGEDREGQRLDAQLAAEAEKRRREEEGLDQEANAAYQLQRSLRRIAELEAQLAERTGAPFPPQTPAPEVPAPTSSPQEGRPTAEWSRDALVKFAERHEIDIPRNWRGLSQLQLLELILAALENDDVSPEMQAAALQEGELTLA